MYRAGAHEGNMDAYDLIYIPSGEGGFLGDGHADDSDRYDHHGLGHDYHNLGYDRSSLPISVK